MSTLKWKYRYPAALFLGHYFATGQITVEIMINRIEHTEAAWGNLTPVVLPTPHVEEPGIAQWFSFESKQGWVIVPGIRSVCKTYSWVLLNSAVLRL